MVAVTLKVTVLDEQTSQTETGHVADGDYVLITAAPCYRDSVQVYPTSGTHVITVKGRTGKPDLNASPLAKPHGPFRP